jgi:hypothetical protein
VENIRYSPATLNETLSRAGVENFLGTFGGLSPDTANSDTWFEYRNFGSFVISKSDDRYDDAYWIVECLRTDVFRSPNNGSWASSLAEYGGSKAAVSEAWTYTTKSGYDVECKLITGKSFSDDTGRAEGYNFMLPMGDYMVAFHMKQPIPEGEKGSFTKDGLEKIIEEFDFGKLEAR